MNWIYSSAAAFLITGLATMQNCCPIIVVHVKNILSLCTKIVQTAAQTLLSLLVLKVGQFEKILPY